MLLSAVARVNTQIVSVFDVPHSCMLSTDSRNKGYSRYPMHPAQRPGHRNDQHRFICNGLRPAHHDACWPAPPRLPPRGFLGNGTLLVETGGIDAILACALLLNRPGWLFIRKGIVWVLIAMVAGFIPVVSLVIFFARLFSPFIILFILQVFDCLNLNGIFLSLLSRREECLLGRSSPHTRSAQRGMFSTFKSRRWLFVSNILLLHRCSNFPTRSQ